VPLGADTNSWVLRHDGILSHNGEEVGRIEELPQEGDIIVSKFFIDLLSLYIFHFTLSCYGLNHI